MKKHILLFVFGFLVSVAGFAQTNLDDTTKYKEFYVVDQIPEFPGGEAALIKWVNQTKIYPEYAKNNRIEGKVLVSFVVDKEGAVTDVKVEKRVHYTLDNEAVRVVKLMPKWKPGLAKDGQSVDVTVQIPVEFK